MKKAISLLSLLLCLVMAFSLVACGDSGSTAKDDDDKDDASSTTSTTSSTESSTSSTGSETTSTDNNSTASQPAGGNDEATISVTAYTIAENKTEIGFIIYHQGETIVAMGEGIAEYPLEEGETFSQEQQDDFKAEVAEAEKELNPNYATMSITADANELAYLVVFKLNVEGGMEYYLDFTDIPSTIFYDGVTFSQLNQSFIDEGFTAEKIQ